MQVIFRKNVDETNNQGLRQWECLKHHMASEFESSSAAKLKNGRG